MDERMADPAAPLDDSGPHLLRDDAPGIECGREATWKRPAVMYATFTTLGERCLPCVVAYNDRRLRRSRNRAEGVHTLHVRDHLISPGCALCIPRNTGEADE